MSNINDIIPKATFLEKIISVFAENKMDEANEAFARRHGYDLRKTNNNDHLRFSGWMIDDNTLVLFYREITPHDCPYDIDLTYNLDNVQLTLNNQE